MVFPVTSVPSEIFSSFSVSVLRSTCHFISFSAPGSAISCSIQWKLNAKNRNSEAFRLITRIQDEAHRFAITFHRQLRGKNQVHSILDDIPGVGPARRKDLMKHFADITAIKNATVEELEKLPSMNKKSAEDVYNFFH